MREAKIPSERTAETPSPRNAGGIYQKDLRRNWTVLWQGKTQTYPTKT